MAEKCLSGLELQLMGASSPANKQGREFNPSTFLATIGEGRKSLTFARKQKIFAQGDKADEVFYIQKGKVRLVNGRRLLWRERAGGPDSAHGISGGPDGL
jgi:hypothetical protein